MTTLMYRGGDIGCKKLREFICGNEECQMFSCTWEKRVFEHERDGQSCPVCLDEADELVGTINGWLNCPERKKNQLKKRSKEHMEWCKKTGTHPNDTGYSPGPREWVNRTRAKNTRSDTLSQLKYAHKDFQPGRQIINH